MVGNKVKGVAQVCSCFPTLYLEIASFVVLFTSVHAQGEQDSQGVLWPEIIRYALDKNNLLFSGGSV